MKENDFTLKINPKHALVLYDHHIQQALKGKNTFFSVSNVISS